MSEVGEVIVEAVALSKTFRDFWNRPKAKAVQEIDFEVRQGEIIGMLGPNGSGKSTTVKMLLGLLYPTAGTVSVFGKNPRDVRTKKRVGYLPEESYLYKYLTPEETLDFYGALFNISASERANRTEQLLDMVGLSHARHRPVGEFSKGMARRIGLAQAMINDPDLLILDEPTSGLDPLGCKEIKDLILLLRERGKTVIICSHLLSDIEDICDRVLILYGGKIRASGSLSDLLKVSDSNTITTPLLSKSVMTEVMHILKKHFSGNDFKIDNPRRSLEDFFLDVVEQARSTSIETSGVVSGGVIADYLKENQSSDEILEHLAHPEKEITPQTEEEKAEEKERIAEEENSVEKLNELAGISSEKPEAAPNSDQEPEKDDSLDEADEKLKHLL